MTLKGIDMVQWLMLSKRITGWVAICLLGMLMSGVALADKNADGVKAVVEKNIAELLAQYEKDKAHFETDPQRFYASMDAALSKIVDFSRIAARVMGKYARQASKEQRGEFTRVFKDSLFSAYTKTLVDSGSFQIKVTNATLNSRSDERASVDMEVITDTGNVYPVTYSMYQNKEGEWLMENVIVFGVNVGLAFKDKFEVQYRANKGDIAAVIKGWTVDIKIDAPGAKDAVAKEG